MVGKLSWNVGTLCNVQCNAHCTAILFDCCVSFFWPDQKEIGLFSGLNNNFFKHRHSRHIFQHNLVQASKLSLKQPIGLIK